MRCWLVALLLLGSCVESSLVVCGDQLCPVGAFCTPDGCVLQDQIDVCRDKAEGDPCQVLDLPAGFCRNGTCVSAICGNNIMEPSEACDDGNHDAGDGCSADCRSLEKCGNNIIDLVKSEQCDVGVPFMSGDGCTSACQAEFDIWRDVTPSQLAARWGAKMVYDPAHGEIVMFGGFNANARGDTWVFRDGAWEERTPASSPEARFNHSMAYLPNVGVVLFGGTNGQGIYFNGTWVWDGAKWTKLSPTNAPSDRASAAMAYYPARNAIWLYGGNKGTTIYNDTWSFDGSQWTEIPLAANARPIDMTYAQLYADPDATDPDFAALWLIGGNDVTAKTYFWETVAWSQNPLEIQGETGTPPHIEPALGLDHGKVILFGGKNIDGTLSNSIFQWDSGNAQWIRLAVTSLPTPRTRAAGATDGTNFVAFGGMTTTNTPQANTYQLVTVTTPTLSRRLASIPTTPLPTARFGAMSTYDGRTGEVFIFAGFTSNGEEENDLWRWRFPLWRMGTGLPPAPRVHGAMTFDEAREETVLFGGVDDCGTGSGSGSGGGPCDGTGSGSGSGSSSVIYFDDTKTLRDNTWKSPVVTLRPPARADAAIAYDPTNEIVLLFGGQNATGSMDDTWQWNGTAWLELLPADSPPTMQGGRMVYDRAHSQFVLYGGVGALGTVWAFDGTTWREVTPPSTEPQPEGRRRSVFLYNPRRQRTLLFGGILPNGQILNDTWEWDGSHWEERHPVQAPTPRYDAAAAYDAARGQVMVFGGAGQLSALLDDVWVYNFVSNSEIIERCDGADADRDGLVDCNDPDCYWRCDPYCPPGSAMCAPNRPRCGDGKVSPLEVGFCTH